MFLGIHPLADFRIVDFRTNSRASATMARSTQAPLASVLRWYRNTLNCVRSKVSISWQISSSLSSLVARNSVRRSPWQPLAAWPRQSASTQSYLYLPLGRIATGLLALPMVPTPMVYTRMPFNSASWAASRGSI